MKIQKYNKLNEDTIKTKDGKWVNKGKEGTHGKFRTKKAADAQRKAMFASGFKEDYSKEEQDWGVPYTYREVEKDLKNITNNFTDKEGEVRCQHWEQEKIYGVQILKKHYNIVEVSDGRTGSGEYMSWVISYRSPKKEKVEEDIAKPFKRDLKRQYKRFDANRDYVKRYNKNIDKRAKDLGIDDPDTIGYVKKKEPKFKPGIHHGSGVETQDFPFYVTYYEESPNYHPEEGGYYIASIQAIKSKGFNTKEEAIRAAKKWAEDYGMEELDNKTYILRSKYIGDQEYVVLETRNNYLGMEKGDEPYQ